MQILISILNRLQSYISRKTTMVNHQEIVDEITTGVEHSWIYYLMLLSAGLIALFGLLTNSVAVVIGAMLISPLMGPIITSGLALTISDLTLARRAFRTIIISVILTIFATTFITILSPLKEPTTEILSRVRPNIYDLFIATFSGLVGAVALCSKRNYLITSTGVAVATAVIPPLSVVGYAIGTGQFRLAIGGFFLFFTNFVAIVLTSNLVFFLVGFRARHRESSIYTHRTRIIAVSTLIIFISIPLVYTLVIDLQAVRTNKRIGEILKNHLNRDNASRLTTYSYRQQAGDLLISASVNTTTTIDAKTRNQIEHELEKRFKQPVSITLEQVLIASSKLIESNKIALLGTLQTPPPPQPESTAELGRKVNRLTQIVKLSLSEVTNPFPVSDVKLEFAEQSPEIRISIVLGRDYPTSEDERILLENIAKQSLGVPVSLTVNPGPLLKPMTYDEHGLLSAESVTALSVINRLPDITSNYHLLITGDRHRFKKQITTLVNYLTRNIGVSQDVITQPHRNDSSDQIRVKVIRSKEKP